METDNFWLGSDDPHEYEISPEMQAKREKIELTNLASEFVSAAFFCFGIIINKLAT